MNFTFQLQIGRIAAASEGCKQFYLIFYRSLIMIGQWPVHYMSPFQGQTLETRTVLANSKRIR